MLTREKIGMYYAEKNPGYALRWADKRREGPLKLKGWLPVESDGEVGTFLDGQSLFIKKAGK